MQALRTNRISVLSVMFVGIFGLSSGPVSHEADLAPEGGLPEPDMDQPDPPSLSLAEYTTRYFHHRVMPGQTLWSIGRAYGVYPPVLADLNGLDDPDVLQPGTVLKVPRDEVAEVRRADSPAWSAASGSAPKTSGSAGSEVSLEGGGSDLGLSLRWPLAVDGRLTSSYGPRWGGFHWGIDVAAPPGTPVLASEAGTVVMAERAGGYGLTVMIKHREGIKTLYAHLSAITVAPGQVVSAGHQVGKVGTTGRSTGPHLHFELRIFGDLVDPEPHLRSPGT